MPTLNTQFVLALPHGYRARAFGVVQQGLQVSQGGAVLLTGVLAEPFLGAAGGRAVERRPGSCLMVLLAARWPRPGSVDGGDRQGGRRPRRRGARGRPQRASHPATAVSGAAGRMDG